MSLLLIISILLFVLLGLITILGHGIWVALAWFFKEFAGHSSAPAPQTPAETTPPQQCFKCEARLLRQVKFCAVCGAHQPDQEEQQRLLDLATTLKQLRRLHHDASIDQSTFDVIRSRIENERNHILFPQGRAGDQRQPSLFDAQPDASSITSISDSPLQTSSSLDAPPTFANQNFEDEPSIQTASQFGSWAAASEPVTLEPPVLKPPRKSFAQVFESFMEQSNIRWGEIVGGVLIVGCSTALVISLWTQISRIPVLKFLIFTTVTAALFGVGFYTYHHWKLPTTSRGILTIAVLLVPLNFLAIAAVSDSTAPSDPLVIGSELAAPAIFLCLVYFAGRVITSSWPNLLAAGVLSSSIGQLLIRHLAGPGKTWMLFVLGAFPILGYAAVMSWMLRRALADAEIDEGKISEIYITLGTGTFATILPFGLLLYRSGPIEETISLLAPLITLGGLPMFTIGTLLWRKVIKRDLIVARTVGTSLALLGMFVALAGMILAWPNPAGIAPAALLNFVAFTVIAVLLELPLAHMVAAGCLTLAYVVTFQVLIGSVHWRNIGATSLLKIINSARTGQALTGLFLLFIVASEWWKSKSRSREAFAYLCSACAVASISLLLLSVHGFGIERDPYYLSLLFTIYGAVGFWLARRERSIAFSWLGIVIVFLAAAQLCGPVLSIQFPWQASLLLFSAITIVAVLFLQSSHDAEIAELLAVPLRQSAKASAIIATGAVLITILAGGFDPARLLTGRTFWLAGVCFGLLVISQSTNYFIPFQMSLFLGAILATRAFLQRFSWFGSPHSWLHPWALEIQVSVLGLICLGFVTVRTVDTGRVISHEHQEKETNSSAETRWFAVISRSLRMPMAFDHMLLLILIAAAALMFSFGTFTGISLELTSPDQTPSNFNLAGFSHILFFNSGAWILLGILFLAVLGHLREQRRALFAGGAILALWSTCPLLAGRFESQLATASVWRWSVAIFLFVSSVTYASVKRWFSSLKVERRVVIVGRSFLLAITLVPLLLINTLVIFADLNRNLPRGPQFGFWSTSPMLLYGLPLMCAAAALAIHAVSDSSPRFVFSAGLLINLSVTTVEIVSIATRNGSFNLRDVISLIQLNSIAAAAVALVWMATRNWWMRTIEPIASEQFLLTVQKIFLVSLVVLFILPVSVHLIALPGSVGPATTVAGNFPGWLALLVSTAAVMAFAKVLQRRLNPISLSAFLIAASTLSAFGIAASGIKRWAGLHVLLSALILTAVLLMLARDLPRQIARSLLPAGFSFADDWKWDCELNATFVAAIVVLVALRISFSDPSGPWWAITSLLAMTALSAWLNWVNLRRVYLYAAAILLNTAVLVWFYNGHHHNYGHKFLEINIIALSLGGVIWLFLELRARRLSPGLNSTTALSIHHFAALLSLTGALLVALMDLKADLSRIHLADSVGLDWLMLASLGVLMIACLWDLEAKYAVAGIYLIGLVKAALILHFFNLPPARLIWAASMAAAIHTLVAAFIWRERKYVMRWTEKVRIPSRIDPATGELWWLSVLNTLLIIAIVFVGLGIDLRFVDWSLRSSVSVAVLIQTFTLALMAQGARRVKWQRAAVSTGLIGLVLLGWSWLEPGQGGTWLNRAVILMTLMFCITGLFAAELGKLIEREPDWTKAIRDCVPAISATGITALAFVLGTEVSYQIQFGAVRINTLALITVAITLSIAVVLCIGFALSPRHDPLELKDRWRSSYVYAAEALLALLFMHLRLTMPWLFSGLFERYWPFAIMAIAYSGVTASELLRRRKVLVLAKPIERTGALLPLLPVIGFWIAASQVEYSTLLFIVGGLYGLISILRESFWFGLAAVLAGNGGLWYLLQHTSEYRFWQHPQLWLIPIAICVLIAAYLNRKDFSESQMAAIRYLTLIAIYVSSTADIFLNGVARSPWLPLILAGWSIAGVFAGMVFRIRAFLLLGSIFLLLAIGTMINYASVNFGWTWLWYVAGIITGALIIATFAVFEKKRAEVSRLVEELKDWKG